MSDIICDIDFAPYGENACGINKSAAISAFAAVKRGQVTLTDFTSPVEWENALSIGAVVIAKGLTIDIPAGSPLNIDPKRACGPAQEQVGFDLAPVLIDPNVSQENDIFYKTLNGKTYDFVFYYCNEHEIRVLRNGQLAVTIPQSVGVGTETQHYNGTFSFRRNNDDFGLYLEAPAGIFD